MSKQKQVWRMNTGRGVPSDLKFKILTKDLRNGHASNAHKTDDSFWLLDIQDQLAVYAYQTTRTKAAKYERKDCFFCSVVKLSDGIKCCDCNGKGYRLERIK